MELKSDNPDHGFQFPGTFELSAMGAADKQLESELPRHLQDAGIDVVRESVHWKHSSNGKYVSVRIACSTKAPAATALESALSIP